MKKVFFGLCAVVLVLGAMFGLVGCGGVDEGNDPWQLYPEQTFCYTRFIVTLSSDVSALIINGTRDPYTIYDFPEFSLRCMYATVNSVTGRIFLIAYLTYSCRETVLEAINVINERSDVFSTQKLLVGIAQLAVLDNLIREIL